MEPSPALYAAWPGRATQIDMLWSYFVASDATRSPPLLVAGPRATGKTEVLRAAFRRGSNLSRAAFCTNRI